MSNKQILSDIEKERERQDVIHAKHLSWDEKAFYYSLEKG